MCRLSIWIESSYFYPRPPRGGRRYRRGVFCAFCPISIHALREEGDEAHMATRSSTYKFLSTPSARRATLSTFLLSYQFLISIHALREEGDQ